MRIFLTFALLLFLISASAQSKQDTLNTLEAKAREYLNQTYTNQNLDSAIPKWHEFVLPDIQEIYKEKGYTLSNQSDLLERLNQDYKKFYTSNKSFALINFTDKDISDESKNSTVYFKYSYQEKVNDKVSISSSYLYFVFDSKTSEWKILDFRISDILGVPGRWLK